MDHSPGLAYGKKTPGESMKIEIGESLVRTWVRHCLGCQFAELNWKPSPVWPGTIAGDHADCFREIKAAFPSDVLKKTSSADQFVRQAEVDVLGVRIENGKAGSIIAADMAFHSRGLQYGSALNTGHTVAKKMLRTAMTLDIHFPGVDAEILFLSPKVNPATIPHLCEAEQTVRAFYSGRRKGFTFRVVINEDFRSEVMEQVALLQKAVDDTSELFLRAMQLEALFKK